MIEDLKFLSMMLGKENSDRNWCYLCQLYIDDWKRLDQYHLKGREWTLGLLKQQALNCKEHKLDGKDGIGVREKPYFDIPVKMYIWPILHTLVGVGNAILDYLIDIIESKIQGIPAKEIRMKRELQELEKAHRELQENRNSWDSSDIGSSCTC